MEIIKESECRVVRPTNALAIYEYDTHDGFISGATAVIDGRYPSKGYAVNEKIKELVYVVEGQGSLLMPSRSVPLQKGDVLFLDHGEKFAWEGRVTLFMATTPTFDPAQHKEVD